MESNDRVCLGSFDFFVNFLKIRLDSDNRNFRSEIFFDNGDLFSNSLI